MAKCAFLGWSIWTRDEDGYVGTCVRRLTQGDSPSPQMVACSPHSLGRLGSGRTISQTLLYPSAIVSSPRPFTSKRTQASRANFASRAKLQETDNPVTVLSDTVEVSSNESDRLSGSLVFWLESPLSGHPCQSNTVCSRLQDFWHYQFQSSTSYRLEF